jgi:acetate kinase
MPSLPVLVLNSGSSSIKFSIFEAANAQPAQLFEGAVDGIGTDLGEFHIQDASGKKLIDQTPPLPTPAAAFALVASALKSNSFPTPAAIGHRMVCGGPTVLDNQRMTSALIDEMERYTAFAPLHTPIAVYIMREALRLFPGVPNFVCLDSYFHRTMPAVAAQMPIPAEYSVMGVRRFGAHGISCESIVFQLEPAVPERLIVAHLGNGCSVTAIRGGHSIDTSMGLTPTGGIISGTRTGDIDPGVLLFILRKIAEKAPGAGAAADQLEAVAAKKSGLLGVSERSNDMRELREAIRSGDAKAGLAVNQFTRTIAKCIAGFIAILGGLDTLVFTGGIGVNDPDSRAEICATLSALGIALDPDRNSARPAGLVSTDSSPVKVRVISPAEDLIIVNHVVRLMGEQ